jgi:hypothetical protein
MASNQAPVRIPEKTDSIAGIGRAVHPNPVFSNRLEYSSRVCAKQLYGAKMRKNDSMMDGCVYFTQNEMKNQQQFYPTRCPVRNAASFFKPFPLPPGDKKKGLPQKSDSLAPFDGVYPEFSNRSGCGTN